MKILKRFSASLSRASTKGYLGITVVRKIYIIIISIVLLASTACELKLKQYGDDSRQTLVEVQRYDRLQSRYLTTGDFSALQQMNIEYAMETRTLIEDVLKIGEVNDPEINSKFLSFYQDTTLQAIIAEAEAQYANMSDINTQMSDAFKRLQKMIPGLNIPVVYSQIGALDQSVIIGNNSIGISLDKYLGEDFAVYRRFYSEHQRSQMTRSYIVPDCLSFYLLSMFPLKDYEAASQYQRDLHIGKIMWVVNKAMKKKVFATKFTDIAANEMEKSSGKSIADMLKK